MILHLGGAYLNKLDPVEIFDKYIKPDFLSFDLSKVQYEETLKQKERLKLVTEILSGIIFIIAVFLYYL